jgi:hypothetical protein
VRPPEASAVEQGQLRVWRSWTQGVSDDQPFMVVSLRSDGTALVLDRGHLMVYYPNDLEHTSDAVSRD